jgi:hypothetical protein
MAEHAVRIRRSPNITDDSFRFRRLASLSRLCGFHGPSLILIDVDYSYPALVFNITLVHRMGEPYSGLVWSRWAGSGDFLDDR